MADKKQSNRAKRDALAKQSKSIDVGNFFKQNKKDPNSNTTLNAKARYKNAQTKEKKQAFTERAFDETMKFKREKFNYQKEQDAKKDNDKLLRAQEREEVYKQRRKESIGKTFSGALESWKFRF